MSTIEHRIKVYSPSNIFLTKLILQQLKKVTNNKISAENRIQKMIPWLSMLARVEMLSSNKQAIKWRHIEKVTCSSLSEKKKSL